MYKLLAILLILHTSCLAQRIDVNAVAEKASKANIHRDVYYLANDSLEGRLMGSHGDTLASNHVADCFKRNNLIGPYNKGFLQTIEAKKIQITDEVLTIGKKKFSRWDGWMLYDQEDITLNGVEVVFAGFGISDSLYDDLKNIDVRGKAVIILGGQPPILKGSQRIKLATRLSILKARGAVAVLRFDSTFEKDKAENEKYDGRPRYVNNIRERTFSLPFIYISKERVNELLSPDHTDIGILQETLNKTLVPASFKLKNPIGLHLATELVNIKAPNVIGVVPGLDTGAGNVIVTAHHDHIGRFKQDIFHGASDNASGTSVLMELCVLLNEAAQKGLHPKRSIILISTDGEEGGDLGSFFYAAHPLFPINETRADLNLDGLGRVDDTHTGRDDSGRYVYVLKKDTKDSIISNALQRIARARSSMKLEYTYKEADSDVILGFMDTRAFLEHSIPCVLLFSGATKDALQPSDSADKINYDLLTEQTKVGFLLLWDLANN